MKRKGIIPILAVVSALGLVAVLVLGFDMISKHSLGDHRHYYLYWKTDDAFSFKDAYDIDFDRVLILNHGYNIRPEILSPLDKYLTETNSYASPGDSITGVFVIFYKGDTIVYVESYNYRSKEVVFTDAPGSIPEEIEIDPAKDVFLPVRLGDHTYFVRQRLA